MKLLSLNTWGGRRFGPLIEFLEKYNGDVDIFCFQEVFDTAENVVESSQVRTKLLEDLSNLFIDYHKYYYPVAQGIDLTKHVDFNLKFGPATFVKKTIKINSEGDFFTHRSRFAPIKQDMTDIPSNAAYLNFEKEGKKILACNIHGIWYPGDKLDNPNRITQSEKIIEFLIQSDGAKILCGDFNLLPDTESIKMLEESGLRNLIREFNIKTTRSKADPYRGASDFQAFADYIFVSKDIRVLNFEVPEVEVSDHLPMILEFE